MDRIRYFLPPLILLALAALACGPFVAVPPTQTPLARTATPTVEGGAGTPGGATPVSSGGGLSGETLNLDDPGLYGAPAGVNTYRMMLVFEFNGIAADGTPVSGNVRGQGSYQVQPLASSLTFTSEGAALSGGPQSFAFTEIEGQQYIITQGTGCLTSASGQPDNPFNTFLDSGGFLTGQAQRLQPDEVINGVNTHVYAIDNTNLDPAASPSNDIREISQGRLYLAEQGGYVVRLALDGQGTSDVLSGDPNLVGDVRYQLDFQDFNQPVSITVPAECGSATGGGGAANPTDFPVLDDAVELNSAEGLLTYRTQRSFDDAVNFYRSEMFGKGWTPNGEDVNAPNASLYYLRETQQATVAVSDQGDSRFISVVYGDR